MTSRQITTNSITKRLRLLLCSSAQILVTIQRVQKACIALLADRHDVLSCSSAFELINRAQIELALRFSA
jgi:hypothetical protein